MLKEFDQTIDNLLSQVDVLISANYKLEQSRDLLLPRLMSGEVSLENVETPASNESVQEPVEVNE